MDIKTLIRVIKLAQNRVATIRQQMLGNRTEAQMDLLYSKLAREQELIDNATRDLNMKISQQALEAAE